MEDNISDFGDIELEQRILIGFSSLKPDQQKAILWLVGCIQILDLIDSGHPMAKEEEDAWRKQAREDNNYMLMVLVEYKKLKDQDRA